LAGDLHHVKLRSHGGSDKPDNLIGLCKGCHKRIHGLTIPLYDEDSQDWFPPLDAARLWLARQIEHCPVRIDEVRRSDLFQEVESAVRSVDQMLYHSQAISDSNHWCSYDVFLKAAWVYLDTEKRTQTPVGAILLLKMVQLYRRRSGRLYQAAAARRLHELNSLLDSLGSSEAVLWLSGIVAYEEAYMRFLQAASSAETESALARSIALEKAHGRPLGSLVSTAQGHVAALRRLPQAGQKCEAIRAALERLQDQIAPIGGPLAGSWVNSSIPVHMAYADLIAGRNAAVIDALAPLVEKPQGAAQWYTGIALLRSGDLEAGIRILERARRSFYSEQRTERRAALLVALGDAYQLAGRADDAAGAYSEALRQPSHMDNHDALAIARAKLMGGRRVCSGKGVYFA